MFTFLAQLTFAPKAVIGAVLSFFVLFIWLYWRPAWKMGWAMKRACDGIKPLRTDAQRLDKHRMEEPFSHSKPLEHAWKEYAETLHEQYGQ